VAMLAAILLVFVSDTLAAPAYPGVIGP
jgi:hypothetical protein